MKKIIFLLLISLASYGQAEFPEGVQISGGQPIVSSVNFLTGTNPNGLQVKIDPVNLGFASSLDSPFKRTASIGLQSDFAYYIGNTPEASRGARLYINKPAILVNGGDHGFGDYTTVTQVPGGSGLAAWASYDSRTVMNGADAFGHLISFQARNVYNGSNSMAYFSGVEATLFHTGSGNIINGYGLHVLTKSGSGTFTNLYGLKIENQTGGTNNYGIVTGLGKNILGDETTILGAAILNGKSELISGQAKTVSTANQYSYFGKTNESVNYAALSLSQNGGATQNLRQWRFQTIEQGVANEGAVTFQASGGRFLIGSNIDNGVDAFQLTGNASGSLPATASNHFIRKGEADTANNLKANKSGDTFTGPVTVPNLTVQGPTTPVVQFSASQSATTGIATAIARVGSNIGLLGSGDTTKYAILFSNNLLGTTNRTLTAPDTDGVIAVNLTGSASLDFPSTASNAESSLTISVIGASVGDVVSLGGPAWASNTMYLAFVSAADTVTVRYRNMTASAIDPAATTFKVKIFK